MEQDTTTALDTSREYIVVRDAMLDCICRRREKDCESCGEFKSCAIRPRWREAWNALNALVHTAASQPKEGNEP